MNITYYQHGDRSERKIALTFDDGPNPYATPQVIDILRRYNVRASFFLIGKWVEKYPEFVKSLLANGHLVGNHTYSHQQGDFYEAEHVIAPLTGMPVEFLRPPLY